MPIIECPNCKMRIMVGFGVTDFVHNCTENIDAPLSITQEDVVITGDWSDFEGTGTRPPQAVLMQGIENQLFGTRAGIMGMKKHAITRRGKRASTHRQRSHLQFIELNKEKENA